MGRSTPSPSKAWAMPSNSALLGGVASNKPVPILKFPFTSQNQRTMPVPGAPRLPMNPFPEIARRRIRMGLF